MQQRTERMVVAGMRPAYISTVILKGLVVGSLLLFTAVGLIGGLAAWLAR